MARDDSFDIFSPDPFGRDIIYGLSTGQERLGLQPPPQGLPVDTRPYDRMQATPRGFISGLFSDVLGGTLNMPSMPRTGIPALDLFYANRNSLFNAAGVGDVQKTAERISYGEPLTTGQGMTLRPREEAINAAMTVIPLVGQGGRVANQAAMTAGRAGARYAERVVPQVMERGGLPAQLLGDISQGSRRQIFIGEKAKTWNKAGAEQFLKLEQSGVDPVDIWKQTGTFRSPDGKLRQEISDVSAIARYDMTPDQLARELDLTAQLTYGKPYQDLDRATKNKLQKEVNDFQSSLNQNLTYEDLYRAYPELAKIESTAEFANIPRGRLEQTRVSSIGAGNVPVNERIVGERMTSKAPTEEELKSVLLHETQHAIQNRENFARGGSAEFFKPNDVFSTEALEDAAVIDKLMRGSNLNQLEAKQRFEKIFNRSPEAGAFAALERVGTGKTLDAAAVSSRGASNPYKAYRSLAGEAEARAVQSRMNMTPQQRLETYPIQSYDVPVNQLIYIDPFGNPLR
jgi:hypothetical protein